MGREGGHQHSHSDPLPLRPLPRAALRAETVREFRAFQMKEGGLAVRVRPGIAPAGDDNVRISAAGRVVVGVRVAECDGRVGNVRS